MRFESRRFATTSSELLHLLTWLQQQGGSTAQYWKPVWLALEPIFD